MSKVWFVTGASRGLGRSVVLAAAEAGHRVVAAARRPEQVSDLVERYGDRVHATRLDVTDAAAAERAVREAVEVFGRLDVVVNNAGYGDLAPVEDVTPEAFRAQIDTNFYGTVHVSKAAIPVLREQGSGHIVQVSSIGGRIGSPGLAAYQSAKWAVGGFSSVLAAELAPFNVKVTVVEPGGMRTDWAGSSMTIPPMSEPYQQTLGPMLKMLADLHGNEPTGPDAAAEAILRVTEAEQPPLHLLLGADAVAIAEQAAEQLAESDAAWRELSVSVSH
ncbi:NAD(P)-dependent dehydrogenase (short-subunit alcohol dehydrogenase family) [Kutzneria viridogrisea]|uniref:NAD(P)-dependent dehydrogenase (Short-subunit alcohol dehydrogenase family) n=1 Tax=Kutzneria viridogrisea TaxID=47990 RepID=A0ABR6B7P5_9PSEU|nr:NAD(P)-dependent dehydrogenase (short-subunit alcohol dehydrogenase family) [Kutzneria viridogrisea]